MNGLGFVKHATDTNKLDRAQRTARREKFKGNHSEKAMMNLSFITRMDFSKLTRGQIRKRKKTVIIAVSLLISIGVFMKCYFLIFGQ